MVQIITDPVSNNVCEGFPGVQLAVVSHLMTINF